MKKLANKEMKPNSDFTRNVLTLMTGTTIAQAIPIAISPILTRIYAPEDFGLLALFVAITSMLSIIVSGKYELAVVLPKKDEDAINIFALGVVIICAVSLMLFILVLLCNNYLVELLGNKEIKIWLYVIPVTVFFSGLFNILTYYNTRKKNYQDIKNVTVIKAIILAIGQLSIGFLKQGASGLIVGQMLSYMFSNMKLLKNIVKEKTLLSKISKIKMILLAKKYSKFPKFELLSALFNMGSFQIPIILMGTFFSATILGFYSLAFKISGLPSTLISGSIGQVFLQKSSELINDLDGLSDFTEKISKRIFWIGVIPFSILCIFGDILFSFIFGDKWLMAGVYTQWISVWLFLTFISSPLSCLFVVLEKQEIGLYFNMVIFTLRIAILIIGSMMGDASQAIFAYVIVGILINIFMLAYLFSLVKIKILKNLTYIILGFFAVSSLLLLFRFFAFGGLVVKI